MKLDVAWNRYHAATRQYRKLSLRTSMISLEDPDSALARARRQEAEALTAYLHVLRDLTCFESEGAAPDGKSCRA
jgi:hypothetical protein